MITNTGKTIIAKYLLGQAPERYEISEIGIYSAGSNPSAGAYDSKTVFAFTQTENWQYVTGGSAVAIDTFSSALDEPEYDNIIAVADPVFQTSADNPIFFKSPRVERYERPRFLNNTILIKGNESDLDIESDSGPAQDTFEISAGSNYIKLSGATVDFTRNSPTDELRLAFSIVNRDGTYGSGTQPERARVLVSFENTNGTQFARLEAEVIDDSSG